MKLYADAFVAAYIFFAAAIIWSLAGPGGLALFISTSAAMTMGKFP